MRDLKLYYSAQATAVAWKLEEGGGIVVGIEEESGPRSKVGGTCRSHNCLLVA